MTIVLNLVPLSQTVGALVGGPKKSGRLGYRPSGWGVADPRTHAPPHVSYSAKFGHSTSVCTEIHGKKIDLSRSAFQGHSKLLEVGSDTDQSATYDFLGPILYRS